MPIRAIVEAPAKLNLALDVLGVAENGYHALDMVMQAISLTERVEVSKSRGYSLRLPGSRVRPDDKNTATKAAAAFFRETGLLAGADIVVHKAVPSRAGMAGGSADAAAVLVALDALYGARLPQTELCRIGALVGADVPFCITGGTARVGGVGDVIEPLPPLPGCFFTIAMPKVGVSTPAAFARYDQMGSPAHPDISAAAAAIAHGDLRAMLPHMQNALEHANGGGDTAAIRRVLDASGAAASMMTGSGAAVFGLFTAQQAAEAAADVLRKTGCSVFVATPVAHGATVVSMQ